MNISDGGIMKKYPDFRCCISLNAPKIIYREVRNRINIKRYVLNP